MSDTKYTSFAANGYLHQLEQLMIEVGIPADEAIKLARLVGLTKDKPPETDCEWEEVMSAWSDVSGLKADSFGQ